jgi:hypothetical protein
VLALLSDGSAPIRPPEAHAPSVNGSPDPRERIMHRHPRDVRVLPKSRDFH